MNSKERDNIRNAVATLGSEHMVKLGKALCCPQAHMCYSKGELATYITIRLERLVETEARVLRVRNELRELFP